MYYFLCFSVGTLAGFMACSWIVSGTVHDLRTMADSLNESKGQLDLVRARIRAVQDNGVAYVKGERMYAIQKPNGKFGKMTLPEV